MAGAHNPDQRVTVEPLHDLDGGGRVRGLDDEMITGEGPDLRDRVVRDVDGFHLERTSNERLSVMGTLPEGMPKGKAGGEGQVKHFRRGSNYTERA